MKQFGQVEVEAFSETTSGIVEANDIEEAKIKLCDIRRADGIWCGDWKKQVTGTVAFHITKMHLPFTTIKHLILCEVLC